MAIYTHKYIVLRWHPKIVKVGLLTVERAIIPGEIHVWVNLL